MAGLWGCLTLSRGAGEEVRWSILAGVLALLGRAFGVDGLPRADGGLGEAAGLGEAVLPLGVAGDAGRCLDKGLGLEKSKNKSWRMENCVNSSQRCTLVPHYLFRPGLKCLKWHMSLRNSDIGTGSQQSKHSNIASCLIVHYQLASQQCSTWRNNIHYAEDFFPPWASGADCSAKLFAAFLLSQKKLIFFFFFSIPSAMDVIYSGTRGLEGKFLGIHSMHMLKQCMKCEVFAAQTQTNPVIDQKQAAGQVHPRLIWFTMQFLFLRI